MPSMKNATKHADELKTLFKRLLKEHKPEAIEIQEPLRALVREFVDLNEFRVATDLEIQELLGTRYPQIEKRVAMITQSLNNIFEREHTMNLNRMKEISRRDARQFLRELPEIHPFVEAYVTLYAFDGHAIPTDDLVVSYLREQGIVEEGATVDDAQRFMEHHLKAEECHDFYVVIRKAVADD